MAELATQKELTASIDVGDRAIDWLAGGLQTPVVLIVFNRPELTRAVLQRIATVRPQTLLVVADGPRADRPGERERCEEVRQIVTCIPWECEVKTNFADQNLGCRRRVISGLHWAFEQVEEAIVLEDDILPDPSFFPFCQEMLRRYRHDDRIAMVSGFNISADHTQSPESYYFSRLTHIWGWATWRRAWAHYDESMTLWPSAERPPALQRVFQAPSAMRYWTPILEGMYRGTGPNTWDYQWMFTNIMRDSLSVVPQQNLVRNLGFGADATHVNDLADAPRVEVGSLPFPLVHPSLIAPAEPLDRLDQELSGWHTPTLPVRALRKARRVLRG